MPPRGLPLFLQYARHPSRAIWESRRCWFSVLFNVGMYAITMLSLRSRDRHLPIAEQTLPTSAQGNVQRYTVLQSVGFEVNQRLLCGKQVATRIQDLKICRHSVLISKLGC